MGEINDKSQEAIIELQTGATLVLAGPGCGKTHILARRISHANITCGVPFGEMLCVTFTNRAAREMKKRIETYIGHHPDGLFVGNIHRFCLRFLYENAIISSDTTILDEDDQRDFFASEFGLRKSSDIKDFTEKIAYIYQRENDHPDWVTRRPQFLPSDTDYERYERYLQFKADNKLVDFDEILLRTYTALLSDKSSLKMASYSWVQVDEVQDMTPLQLAIIESVCDSIGRTAMFLGDEQQAIFNFIGAGGRALDSIKRMCSGNIIHLYRNYRSPKYLVEMCNNIAASWLNIDVSLLPTAICESYLDRPLTCFSASLSNLRIIAASTARRWLAEQSDENVMILVRTNGEGDDMSYVLNHLGIKHFHISKQDVFHQIPFKTVWSHLAAVLTPHQWHSWARLLYQTDATKTLAEARQLVALLRENAISPIELLAPGKPGILQQCSHIINDENSTIVVIDTETTGIDIFTDDIVQIAAVKIQKGKIIEGSQFEIFINSEKRVPLELADGVPNPIYEIYNSVAKEDAATAFSKFFEYIGYDAVIAGHNIEFDLAILRNNISRRSNLSIPRYLSENAPHIDTLTLSQLIFPQLRNHRLSYLIDALKINGTNSHNASDDVAATALLLCEFIPHIAIKIPGIEQIKSDAAITRASLRFAKYYGEFYQQCRKELYSQEGCLSEAISSAHDFFIKIGAINRIDRLEYILKLIDDYIVDTDDEPNLREQLSHHLYDLLTYHESDLFANGIIRERLSVMTVHKAKGLEADNVVILDATSKHSRVDDHARLLYVAFSRAKKRLAVGMSQQADVVLQSVLNHFSPLSRKEMAVAINAEMLNMSSEEDFS
ncbi:MAG: UvrD-helicase domain-containing protein [Muribaculaceae bacterium]|nr:UvrD-helicase domain-containing protein [Muribaculaceae bacterium]